MYKRYEGDQIVLLDEDYNVIGLNDPKASKATWAQLQVRSVQHTGTHFVYELLRKFGWDARCMHFTKENKESGFIISPIRDPRKCYITWISRKRKENFLEQWKLFNEAYLTNKDLYVIPIDTIDRDQRLEELSNKLKCHLKTNWKPVGSREHVEVDIDKDVLEEVYSLPVVRKFYAAIST